MFSILISVVVAIITTAGCNYANMGTGGTVTLGILSFFVALILMGLVLRRKTAAINNELQELMTNAQKRITRKVNIAQNKPGANPKLLQRQIDSDQKAISTQALEVVEKFAPLKKWNILMGKQISTMRLQFLFQLKEFKEVDEIFAIKNPLSKPLLTEPLLVAMKMARQYKHDDIPGIEKTFKRHVKWFRGYRATLLYGVLSWVYVKSGEAEKARNLLAKGKESTYDETLANNWILLSNDKVKKFSNAGLGEEWFSLGLEKPPAPKQQRMRQPKGQRF